MILKSFDAFIKIVRSEFTLEELTGVVTKERIDQIVSDIREEKFVSEKFYLKNVDKEKDGKDCYALKIDWYDEDRSGILIIKYKDEVDWYKFNLGSLHLGRLYDLVPDLERSDEVELKAFEE